MEFYEKRPRFIAVQFDGTTESIKQMADINPVHSYTIEETSAGCAATVGIQMGATVFDLQEVMLQKHEWLVCSPDGQLSTVTADEMRRRFEAV